MSTILVDVGSRRLFARRHPRLISVGAVPYGVNLHRLGGISLSGLPGSGGTTVCWGRMRAHCEHIDRECEEEPLMQVTPTDRPGPTRVSVTRISTFGPFMIRVGRGF